MSVPPPVTGETCVLCGTAIAPGAERCDHCALWVGVDGPTLRRPIHWIVLLAMAGGIAAVWLVTLALAALVGRG